MSAYSKLEVPQLQRTLGSLKACLKHRWQGPTPRVSESVGQGLQICFSNKFPDDGEAASLGTLL